MKTSSDPKLKLAGKVALVTGSAQGIGEAIARKFHLEGAVVILSDINDARGEVLAKSFGLPYLHLDVSSEQSWLLASDWIKEKYGRLDLLVNNAGVTGFQDRVESQDPETASLESWRGVMAVNLDGVFMGCKMGIALMKKQGGSIINISSRSGMVGIPQAAAYAASKAGVRNHTKSVALYCAQRGYKIRCNSLHPALILTPMWEPMLGTGEERLKAIEALTSEVPMRTIGQPEDVANAALFLACDDSRYITGSEINIDGGLLAGSAASPGSLRTKD